MAFPTLLNVFNSGMDYITHYTSAFRENLCDGCYFNGYSMSSHMLRLTLCTTLAIWCVVMCQSSLFWKHDPRKRCTCKKTAGILVFDVDQSHVGEIPWMKSSNAFNMPTSIVSVMDIFDYTMASSKIDPPEAGEIVEDDAPASDVELYLNEKLSSYDEIVLVTYEDGISSARTKSLFIKTLFESVIDVDEKIKCVNILELFYLLHPEITSITFNGLLARYNVVTPMENSHRRRRHVEIVDLFQKMLIEQDPHALDDDDRAATMMAEYVAMLR